MSELFELCVLFALLPCRPANVPALQTAVNSMYDDMNANDWLTQLDALADALTYAVGPANPFTSKL